jgi:hypothetical protein
MDGARAMSFVFLGVLWTGEAVGVRAHAVWCMLHRGDDGVSGGKYGSELGKQWGGILDLTCEFPEGCRAQTKHYKCIPCWDGTPPSAEMIEEAARFCVEAREDGDVLVHCAHGRGRSTTCMVAALTKARLYPDWQRAFEACKRRRPVVALNRAMRHALTEWERISAAHAQDGTARARSRIK